MTHAAHKLHGHSTKRLAQNPLVHLALTAIVVFAVYTLAKPNPESSGSAAGMSAQR